MDAKYRMSELQHIAPPPFLPTQLKEKPMTLKAALDTFRPEFVAKFFC